MSVKYRSILPLRSALSFSAWSRFVVVSSLTALPWLVGCAESRPLVSSPTSVVRETSDAEAAVEIELQETRLTINEDGTWKRVYVTDYVVKTQTGVEYWSDSQAYFSPWFESKPVIDATVTNVDASGKKVEHRLDQALLATESAYPQMPDVYSDTQVLRAPLPQVAIGSHVHESITTSSHKPFLDPAYLHRTHFGGYAPIKKVRFVVDAPESVNLRFAVHDAQVKKTEKKANGRQLIEFEATDLAALKPLEDALPSDVVRWPYVSVTVGESWDALSKKYGELIEASLKGIDFKATVKEILAKDDSDDDKVQKILQWVKSRVRYVGVEFGESAVIPYAPDQTLARGFGDCKDQATLMVGLLRAAGFDAQVALLSAGTGEDIDPEQPALNVFNHAIAFIAGKDGGFVDPTADLMRWGTLPTGDQGRYALLAGSGSGALVKIPEAVPATNRYSEQRVVQMSGYGKAKVEETSSGSGYFDWELRDTFAVTEKERDEKLKKYIERTYGSELLSEVVQGAPRDLQKPFSATLKVGDSDVAETWLLEASADLREGMLFNWLPGSLVEGDEERKAPLLLRVPYQAELVWTVETPANFVPTSLPEATTLDMGPVKLMREVEQLPNHHVRMKSRLEPKHALLSADEVNAFREAYKVWESSLLPRVVFEHQAQVLESEGKLKDALDMLRKAAASGSDKGMQQLRLAKILWPYLYEEAKIEAKKATEADPKNKNVWLEYGDLLTANRLEDDLGEGYARADALAAYEQAQKLDPEMLHLKLRRAYILEHDEKGQRYRSSLEDLNQAIALYDSIPEKELREYDDGGYANSVLFTLFWAKRYDELLTRLSKMPRDEVPAGLAVMARAAIGGASAALAEVKRLDLEGATRASALEGASGILAGDRRYADAAELLEAVRAEDDPGGKLKSRALMMRSLHQVDLQKMSEKTPGDFAVKVMALAATEGDEDGKLSERFVARAGLKKGKESAMAKALNTRPDVVNKLITKEFFGDLTVSGHETQVVGNDAEGYRVRLTFRYGGGNTSWLYIVKEQGAYKLRAMSGHMVEVGAEALDAAQKGDRKKAERWLNWARETVQGASGEDPLRLTPFARLWNDGKGDMEAAAAALAASSDSAKQALSVLLARLKSAKSDEERQIFNHALLHAYAELEDDAGYLETARRLYQLVPNSDVAEDSLLGALYRAEKIDEYSAFVEKKLKEAKKESDLYSYKSQLADALEAKGKYKEARAQMQQILKEHAPKAGLFNNLAWNGFLLGPTEEDVRYALRSLEMNRSVNSLHTLGCIYAEMGRMKEAGEVLRELTAKRKGTEPWSVDWYIVGRIAEHLSMPQVAKVAYKKVEKPKSFAPTATYGVAQRRLKKL